MAGVAHLGELLDLELAGAEAGPPEEVLDELFASRHGFVSAFPSLDRARANRVGPPRRAPSAARIRAFGRGARSARPTRSTSGTPTRRTRTGARLRRWLRRRPRAPQGNAAARCGKGVRCPSPSASVPLEPHPEPELELPLLEAGRRREALAVGRHRDRRDRRARRSRSSPLTVCVCTVLKTFFNSPMISALTRPHRHEPRVAQVHVLPRRQVERVAADADRPVAADAVVVQVPVAGDVHRQAAVELHQDAELVVVEDRAQDAARVAAPSAGTRCCR